VGTLARLERGDRYRILVQARRPWGWETVRATGWFPWPTMPERLEWGESIVACDWQVVLEPCYADD
jgi:hypothetical protein